MKKNKNIRPIQTSSIPSFVISSRIIFLLSTFLFSTTCITTTSAFWIHPYPHSHSHPQQSQTPSQPQSSIFTATKLESHHRSNNCQYRTGSKIMYYQYLSHCISTSTSYCHCCYTRLSMGQRRLYNRSLFQHSIPHPTISGSGSSSSSSSSISNTCTSIRTNKSNVQSFRLSSSCKRNFQSFRLFSSSGGSSNSNNNSDAIQINNYGDEDQQLLLNQMRYHLYNEIFSKILDEDDDDDDDDDDKEEDKTTTSTISSQPLTILLAVSGGCDSIALLHFMLQLMKNTDATESTFKESSPIPTLQRKIFECHSSHDDDDNENATTTRTTTRTIECNVHVIHFDHQQRGEESDGDRLFVQTLCEKNNIPFHCFYWDQEHDPNNDDENMSNNNKNSIHNSHKFSQEIARNWRRKKSLHVLEEIMSSSSSLLHHNIGNNNKDNEKPIPSKGVIFTAHHKDDAEETMIMKLLRGVHLTNWSGMDSLQRIMTESESTSTSTNNHTEKQQQHKHKHHLYLGKPMLCIRKKSIQDFLVHQGLEWREDKSNQTDKYLRNRVRHQLMPILQDLVGGEDVLGTRLENIEEQSRKIGKDVSSRAKEYLGGASSTSLSSSSSSSYFPLPIYDKSGSFSLVEEEALYQWIRIETKNTVALSYDTISRISQQIMNFPERRQWKLNLGGDWYIKRNGDILELESPKKNELMSFSNKDCKQWIIIGYSSGLSDPVSSNKDILSNEEESHSLSFSIKQQESNASVNFSLDTVKGNERMRFVPPWRGDKASSGVKIKEFLRGQKIPLHLRESVPIVCVEVDGIVHIAAVYIETSDKAKWIVNKMFQHENDDEELVTLLVKRTI